METKTFTLRYIRFVRLSGLVLLPQPTHVSPTLSAAFIQMNSQLPPSHRDPQPLKNKGTKTKLNLVPFNNE
jgi:hypothetical protein